MSNEKQQGYRVVYEGGQGEYVEKKSRFIATVRPVESEKEATDLIVLRLSSVRIMNLQDVQMTGNQRGQQGVRCLTFYFGKIFIMLLLW